MASPVSGARTKVVDSTTDGLRLAILRGDHAAGDNLPPERILAAQYSVSRLTLRAAISRLQNEGLIQPIHGSGNRVLAFREHGGLELLGPLLQVALGGSEVPWGLLSQLLEVRRTLAAETLALVAAHAADDELVELRRRLAQADPAADTTDFMHWELGFARNLVQASGNLPLELLFNTVSRTLRTLPGSEVLFSAPGPAATVTVYGGLLDKITERKPAAVRKLAARLLERKDRRLVAALQAMHGEAERSLVGMGP